MTRIIGRVKFVHFLFLGTGNRGAGRWFCTFIVSHCTNLTCHNHTPMEVLELNCQKLMKMNPCDDLFDECILC